MSTYKQFLSSDITISPFEVNKSFSFQGGSELTGSNDVAIDRFLGKNTKERNFVSGSWQTTGGFTTQYRYLIYNSVKQLYYSNYTFTSSSEGDTYNASGYYLNTLETDLYFERFFPTSSDLFIGVVTIPSKLYGNRIQPKSFRLVSGSDNVITDDGEGNLLVGGLDICGNIFYNQGLAILTSNGTRVPKPDAVYGAAVFGESDYGLRINDPNLVENFMTTDHITCSFSSSFDILETQYKCTIGANDFNYSFNPSLLDSSVRGNNQILNSGSALYSNFATSSDFSPFVTTVGLYNDNQDLVAVGKLAQPLPTSKTTDTTIFINIDR